MRSRVEQVMGIAFVGASDCNAFTTHVQDFSNFHRFYPNCFQIRILLIRLSWRNQKAFISEVLLHPPRHPPLERIHPEYDPTTVEHIVYEFYNSFLVCHKSIILFSEPNHHSSTCIIHNQLLKNNLCTKLFYYSDYSLFNFSCTSSKNREICSPSANPWCTVMDIGIVLLSPIFPMTQRG